MPHGADRCGALRDAGGAETGAAGRLALSLDREYLLVDRRDGTVAEHRVLPIAFELTYMAAVWLLTSLSWRLDQALERDERWGIWSIRGRLLWYVEAVIEMTDAAHVLPGINRAAQDCCRCCGGAGPM